jgi:hypothetical protein
LIPVLQDGDDGFMTTTESGSAGGSRGEGSSTTSNIDITSQAIRIFPNPSSVYVEVDLGSTINGKVSLINILGREMYHVTGELTTVRIDVQSYDSGVYFISIQNGDERVVKKIKISH